MKRATLAWALVALALCLSCAEAAFKETGKKEKVDKTCMPPQSEMDALVLLYHHLGGAEWRKNDNWLKGNPCGVGPRDAKNWIGVLCSPCKDNVRHVEVLALEWNNLAGELGPWIGQLPKLQVLNVGTNALTGELPVELGALTRLRVLKIAYNRLTGKLPKELYAAHDLELLDAPYNDLIANLNEMLTAFPRMKILNMRGNRGVGGDLGALGPQFAQMKDLKILDCHWNNIGGELPAELFSMPNLQELALSNNDLSGSLPSSMSLPKLKVLQLADNYIEGSLPSALGSLPALMQLDLEKNDIEGTVPAEMGQLSKATEIKLKYNRLSGELPASLFALPSLTLLDLTANQISGQLPASVGDCAGGSCTAGQPLPVVQKLLLGSNRLVSTVPAWIGQLSSLTDLSLADNKFYGSIPSEIGSLNGLEVLNLRTNNFSGPVPDSIGQLVNLKVLELHGNKLTQLPASIGQCRALQTLLLHRNTFAGSIPESLGQLTALKQLSLHSNLFTGSVPNSLGNLLDLVDLTVHENRLDGNPWLRIESNPSVQPFCEDLSEPDGAPRKIKYFRTCGTRNDFYVDVLLRENRSEWRETHSDNWEACYGKCRANAEYPHHYEFQRTSRYQDMYEVADKARFAAYVKRMHRKKGPEFDFHPPTFRFPYEYEAWKAEHAKDPSGYWLLKPTISCCGQNIRLIQGPDDPTMPADLGNWIIQRFVHPPMIVQEHKYVLRLFAMVTSFSPLRVYLFPDGDVFYTHDKYSVAPEKQKKRGNFITDYFFTKKQRDFFTTSNQLFDYLHQQGIDTDAIYRDISDVVVKALMVAEPSMRNQERDRISHPESVYEVVGYDIVLDKNHKPYVCEVNTTPNMGLEINRGNDPVVHEEDFEVKTRIMHDCLQITGTIPPPDNNPKATQAGCSQIVKDRLAELGLAVNTSVAYCSPKDFSCLSEDDIALLVEFECELQRRGEFELMFPGPNADKYLPLFEHERRENYLNVWWYKTRHPDAPVQRPCATPWSCRYPRVWREGKFATYSEADWERHTWTQNVPGNRWNTEEEGVWPSGKAEKRYILDDGDAFDDLPNYAADSSEGAAEDEPLEDEYEPADGDFGGEDEAEGEAEEVPGWMDEAPEGDAEAEMDSYDIPQ